MMDHALLTVRDVADRLRVSLATVYALVKRGAIASLRIGLGRGAIRIRPSDLQAYEGTAINGTMQPPKQIPSRTPLKHIKLK